MRHGTSKLKTPKKTVFRDVEATANADLISCYRAGVHRQLGKRRDNALVHLGYLPARSVVLALQRAGSTWWAREEQRIEERHGSRVELSLRQRAQLRIVHRFSSEIVRRGGETHIHGKYGTVGLEIADRRDGLYLLRAEGWRQYSRRYGARRARIAYLCGRDDNGDFAARVPATCATVQDALDHLTPAEVRKARADGRQVMRQGDVWIVERKPRQRDDTRKLPDSHVWDAKARMLRHAPADGRAHGALHVPYYWRAVPQSTLQMGRDSVARWGGAD